jgi:hypothetical protein
VAAVVSVGDAEGTGVGTMAVVVGVMGLVEVVAMAGGVVWGDLHLPSYE